MPTNSLTNRKFQITDVPSVLIAGHCIEIIYIEPNNQAESSGIPAIEIFKSLKIKLKANTIRKMPENGDIDIVVTINKTEYVYVCHYRIEDKMLMVFDVELSG